MHSICYKKNLLIIFLALIYICSITGCIKISFQNDTNPTQTHVQKMWEKPQMYEVVNTISAYNSYYKDIKMAEYPQGANIICIGEEGEFYITRDKFYVPAKDLKISEN